MDINEFFRLLGVMPGASLEEIRKAYKARARETHPDLGGDKEKFQDVQHAYKMLTDPKYRYDSSQKRTKRVSEDLELRLNISVPFEDAFFGRTLKVNYNRPNKKTGTAVEVLTLEEPISPGSQATREFVKTGFGIRDGDQVGDALVCLRFEQHPRFRIQGMDVVYEKAIPLKTLLKGGEIPVETMWGVEVIKIKPASSPGDIVRIPLKGVSQMGDQLVVLGLVYPKKDEFKQDEFWTESLEINFE